MMRTKAFILNLITLLLVPALFFTALEFGLKLADIGMDYDYFKLISIEEQGYHQDNPHFADQYFPSALGITPLPNTFSADKDDNVLRIFVLGGSAARGFPNPHHGFSQQLEVMLQTALPDKQVEVINTAMTAINSHVVYEIAQSTPASGVDYAILFLGNNEVVGPYGPGTVYQHFLSSPMLIRLIQWIKRLRISQLLSQLFDVLAPHDDKADLVWMGMQMFTQNIVRHDDPRLQGVYRNYERNLADMVKILRDKGAHVILSTIPVNLRDSAPFASEHSLTVTGNKLDQWRRISREADSAFDDDRWTDAAAGYQHALVIDPDYADSHYRLGIAYAALGKYEQSVASLKLSRDLDALRFRADLGINAAIRRVANKMEADSLIFVDNEAIFEGFSQPEAPGWDLFLEHVHFTFTGNYLLADSFSMAILQDLGRSDAHANLSESEVAQRIGYPNLMTVNAMNRLLDMVQSPPFTGQSNHVELVEFVTTKNEQVKKHTDSLDELIQRYLQATEKGAIYWRIHLDLADLYEKNGDTRRMRDHLQKAKEMQPHDLNLHLMTARAHKKDGRYRDEITSLHRATVYARDDSQYLASILGQLGVAYYNSGDKIRAVSSLQKLVHNHKEQVSFNLLGYSVLIEIAKRSNAKNELKSYADQIWSYGDYLLRSGRLDSNVIDSIAKLLRSTGQHDRARAWMNEATTRAQDSLD